MLELVQPFLLSLAIGLLIGIERERKLAESNKAVGLRTFILFSLLGTLAAKVNNQALTLSLSLFVFATLLISYFRATEAHKTQADIGVTTEMAAATVFMLGYLVYHQMPLASSLATALFLILYGRSSLHQFAKKKITAKEIEASVTIIIISLAVISFLPARAIDPWGLFNPQKAGILILILASIQFGGYIAIRLFGHDLGVMLLGFFGGLISSTAVFANIAEEERKKTNLSYPKIIAGIYATIASLFAFLLVVFIVNLKLFQILMWPLGGAILIGVIISYPMIGRKNHSKMSIEQTNPLDVKAVLKLAGIIMGILLLISLTNNLLGEKVLPIATFITGLFDIHGIAYALSVLYTRDQLALSQATQLLMIAVAASFVSKFVLIWIIAHNRFAVILSSLLCLMILTGGLIYWFMPVNL